MHRISAVFVTLTLSVVAYSSFASQTAQAQTYSILYSFHGPDGYDPLAGLTLDKIGNLYGTSPFGLGASTYGLVYRLKHTSSGWSFNALHYFDGDIRHTYGAGPFARVVFGPDGKLYGTTIYGGAPGGFNNGGCGVVFSLSPAPAISASPLNWIENVIYTFTNLPDGCAPGFGALVFDKAGTSYGTTENGGLECQEQMGGCGTVYAITSHGENTLYRFAGGNDGADPRAGVIVDGLGNLYGTTRYGGGQGCGIVYKLAPNGAEQILHRFTCGSDGGVPAGGLVFDTSGNLYGTTSTGGSGGGGTIFKLTSSDIFSVIYSFPGDNGPEDSLTMDLRGNLYGTTYYDGSGLGMVFQLTPQPDGSWTFTELHDFGGRGQGDGAYPIGGVALDRNGNLYGTTASGGVYGYGVIWELTP
jgi:uncharacterized repeat protein (TIGR03803 family)